MNVNPTFFILQRDLMACVIDGRSARLALKKGLWNQWQACQEAMLCTQMLHTANLNSDVSRKKKVQQVNFRKSFLLRSVNPSQLNWNVRKITRLGMIRKSAFSITSKIANFNHILRWSLKLRAIEFRREFHFLIVQIVISKHSMKLPTNNITLAST